VVLTGSLVGVAVQSWRSRYESTPLKKRFRKVREIVDNQARYTDNLRKIHLHYWAPFRAEAERRPGGGALTEAQVRDLFGNLDKILTLAEGMTAALRERVNNLPDHHDQPISDSFVQYVRARVRSVCAASVCGRVCVCGGVCAVVG
jgi:hypothetical protein